MNHIWIVERNINCKVYHATFYATRRDARDHANYYNGFSKGKKTAQYKVIKYVRAE